MEAITPSNNFTTMYLLILKPQKEVNDADCIATHIPPNPSEKAEKAMLKSGEIISDAEKIFTAFVTSAKA